MISLNRAMSSTGSGRKLLSSTPPVSTMSPTAWRPTRSSCGEWSTPPSRRWPPRPH